MVLPRQNKLFQYPNSKTAHGGSLAKGKRKTARPIAVKESMHVVLRGEKARGALSLLLPPNAKLVHKLMRKYAKLFECKVYNFANVGNHMHLIVKPKTKDGFRNFLRVFTGQSAQQLTQALKGSPLKKRFWDLLVFTRVICWGRAYTIAKNYIFKNVLEGASIKVSWLHNSS